MKDTIRCSLVSFVLVLLALPAHAVPLPPGGTVLTPGTTLTDRPEMEGDIIASDSVEFTGANTLNEVLFTGTLVEAVVSENGSHTLDFYYAISNDAGSSHGIASLSAKSFAGFLTDVDWLSDSGGDVGPSRPPDWSVPTPSPFTSIALCSLVKPAAFSLSRQMP